MSTILSRNLLFLFFRLCLYLFLPLAVFSLLGCNKANASSSESPSEPVFDLEQLLDEPALWHKYSEKERFTIYNAMLEHYGHDQLQRKAEGKTTSYAFIESVQRLDDIFLLYLNSNPDDPYNSYYLYNTAGHYIERGERTMGLWLLRSMYQKFPDLSLQEYPSVHYLTLDAISRMEDNIDYRITAIQDIISNYDTQDLQRGVWLYRLGKAYETKAVELLYTNREEGAQRLEAAMNLYRQFFNLDSVAVPEEPNARSIVASKMDIYNANRDWYTDPSLDNLIRKIQYALSNNKGAAVLYYQANGFFVLSADYRDDFGRSPINIYLPHFLGGVIQFGDLTPESNEEEAWLYSTNWPFHLTTWYLYFRKINYPTDPEIDGNWEWAGIYLGDFY